MPWRIPSGCLLALPLLIAAAYPTVVLRREAGEISRALDALARIAAASSAGTVSSTRFGLDVGLVARDTLDPALLVRVTELGPLLASWQTVGGCGAGSATGAGAGIKWVGRGVTGGLFNVQTVGTYNSLNYRGRRERNVFVNTLISRGLDEKWVLGANVPLIYKYFDRVFEDPFGVDPTIDLSNGGVGDVSVQLTRKLGRINATSLTALVGAPTGVHDARYAGSSLAQHRQLGFGKVTGSLILDHTIDEIWGVIVVGGLASWRGGQNELGSYRAPSATTYAFTGYFLGPFVPTVGVGVTGFSGHDRDQTQQENTGLLAFAGNVSVEWSTDWIAVLAGASLPYQYDGITVTSEGRPRSPWGFGSLILGLGVSLSPF